MLQIMAQTARFVREAGGQAEFVLRVRQAANPAFAFLAPGDRCHAYFRWLLEATPQVGWSPSVVCCSRYFPHRVSQRTCWRGGTVDFQSEH